MSAEGWGEGGAASQEVRRIGDGNRLWKPRLAEEAEGHTSIQEKELDPTGRISQLWSSLTQPFD